MRHDNSEITQFDTSCFSGEYITDDVTEDYLQELERARSDEAKARKREAWSQGGLTEGSGKAVNA